MRLGIQITQITSIVEFINEAASQGIDVLPNF